ESFVIQYGANGKDADTLEAEQKARMKLICEMLQLRPGMRVLDIGCGGGGLSQYMATHYGVSVVGVTIAAEQQKMAQTRCDGLDVSILLEDYPDINDHFDRIVSVGMFETFMPKSINHDFCVFHTYLKLVFLFP
ncbi:class I SAM-dependent methyltransferase, partial [Salmonella enterica]|uniref:class I SAM-dependent methyltransferase n=1 Tax=Salmonella enterica TaxID=28901 RepID=UPI00398C2A21